MLVCFWYNGQKGEEKKTQAITKFSTLHTNVKILFDEKKYINLKIMETANPAVSFANIAVQL